MVNRPVAGQRRDARAVASEVPLFSLQPAGPGYGTTPQDDTAWTTAMNASSIDVS